METYSNIELFQGIKNRDNRIMEHIINRYKPAVQVMIKKMGGDDDQAQEVFHDGLQLLIDKIIHNRFPLTGKFQNVLHMVCSNIFKDELRKRKAGDKYFSEIIYNHQTPDFSSEFNIDLLSQIMHESIEILPELCKKIFKSFMRRLSLKDIAEDLELGYVYIRKRFISCRNELETIARNKLENYDNY